MPRWTSRAVTKSRKTTSVHDLGRANKTKEHNYSYVDPKTLTMHLNMSDAGQTMSVFGLDAGDAIPYPQFAIAHELGHVMGVPDEYAANLYFEPHFGLDYKTEPRPLRFPQREPGYPFHTDMHAMMMNACCPRLRYVQCYASFLDAHRGLLDRAQSGAANAQADYIARYAEYGAGLTYRRKRGATPWAAIGQGALPNKLAELALFGCGEDEGLVDKMFPRPPGVGSGEWLDGVVVVRTRVWFDFVESNAGAFHGHVEPWHILQGFYRELVDRQWTPRVCFFLEAPSVDDLRRVGVVFEVLSEYGALPSPNATIGEANVVVHVPFAGGAPKLSKPLHPGPTHVVAGPSSFAWSVLRKVLETPGAGAGGAGVVPLASNNPLQASDVGEVARGLEKILGRPPGSYSVQTISMPWKP